MRGKGRVLRVQIGQCRAEVGQYLLAQQNKGLLCAACRDVGAVDVLPGKEILAHRAGSGTGVAEEVVAGQGEPLLQCSGIKAGADGGVEQHLAGAQLGKFLAAQQQNIFVQAGEHHFAFGQQLRQGLVGHACGFCVRLVAAAVIADFCPQEL